MHDFGAQPKLADLWAWWEDNLEQHAQLYAVAADYARKTMLLRRGLAAHDGEQITEIAELLEGASDWLSIRRKNIPLCMTQMRTRKLGRWAVAALAVYDDNEAALRNIAQLVVGKSSAWPQLSRALVENHLKGWRDWRQSEDPQKWVAKVARHLMNEDAELFPDTRLEDPEVPIEEILETAAEFESSITVERRYSFDGFKGEARRRNDWELLAYIEALEAALAEGRNQRGAHRAARRALDLNKHKASAVRRRFKRLKEEAAEIVTQGHPAMGDANRTAYFEPLDREGKGPCFGTWAHRKPQR
jgi:hypothetical protein